MSRRGYDDYYRDGGSLPVRTREREYDERGTYSRPAFLESDYGRNDHAGAMVLRGREQETLIRQRPRSVSPVRVRETRYVERSPTPTDYSRTRVVERERERERQRSPSPQLRARVVETRERIRERTPSPVRVQERYVERRVERERSPSPIDRVRIRNIEEREVVKQPLPVPAPRPPSPIQAPPIHQEVITHHRHIHHGFERAREPTPPPAPAIRQTRLKETDIDIYNSRNHTDIDITRRTTEDRSIARPRTPVVRREHFRDDSYLYESERDRLRVEDTRVDISRRRSLSARPPPVRERSRERVRIDIRDNESEADYYARKANERAFIGEAYNGATKDWTIVDVPPGTERVRMDGVGGGSQEISWQKYNGVRRSRFIPERDRESISSSSGTTVRDRVEIRDTDLVPASSRDTTTLDIEISSRRRGGGAREYEREYERIEERENDRRVGPPRKQKVTQDLWTEITKDLVTREAIEELGYDFEETEYFFYIIQYLRYEDVLELVQLTEHIRRERSYRAREIEWERQQMERHERRYISDGRDRLWDRPFDDERVTEREVIYSNTSGGRKGRRW